MSASANLEHLAIEVRPYTELDAASTLAIFIAAVTETASAGYTVEQTEAWADIDARDLHSWGRAMAARRLLEHGEALARKVGARALTADVSITARPFFERFGFVVTTEQHPVKRGIKLTNFAMSKPLALPME